MDNMQFHPEIFQFGLGNWFFIIIIKTKLSVWHPHTYCDYNSFLQINQLKALVD